ncbi:MAG: hypothetical protein U1U88_001503 [Lawsonella clevelandensis]
MVDANNLKGKAKEVKNKATDAYNKLDDKQKEDLKNKGKGLLRLPQEQVRQEDVALLPPFQQPPAACCLSGHTRVVVAMRRDAARSW